MKKRLYILAIAIFMICNNVSAIYELASGTTGYIPSTDTTAVVPPAPEIPDTSDVIPPNVPDTGTVAPPPAEPSAPSIEGRKVVEYPHVVASGKKQQMSLSLEGNNLRVKGQIWAQGTKEHYLDYQIMADSAYICRVDMDYKNTKAYLLDIDVLIPGFAGDKYKVTFEALDVSLSATDEAKQRKTMLIERGNYAAQPEMENTFLVDGRSWKYSKVMLSDKGDKIEEQFSITVGGDTLFDNRWCKSLIYTDGNDIKLAGYAYETDDRKVFVYNTLQMDNAIFLHEGWMCTNDFSLNIGESVTVCHADEDKYVVSSMDSITVKDASYIRWGVSREGYPNDTIFRIVEGIGNSKYGIYAYCPLDIDGYPLYYFDSCYQGDSCIFEASDYNLVSKDNKKSAFLVEGRTWNYRNDYTKELFSITVNGDSLFEGKQCKILEYTSNGQTKLAGYAYETEDKRIFIYNLLDLECCDFMHEGWLETNNFGLSVGDSINFRTRLGFDGTDKVDYIDTIIVNNKMYRRWNMKRSLTHKGVLHSQDKKVTRAIVDGIGNAFYTYIGNNKYYKHSAGIYSQYGEYYTGTHMTVLLSVYDGDKCVFNADDFVKEASLKTANPHTLVEDRSWKYKKFLHSDSFEFSITVGGDTIFDDRWCKKLLYSDENGKSLAGMAYETEDGKVNIYNTLQLDNAVFLHKGWMCTNDFGLEQGDKVPFIYGFEETPYIVGRIDSIDVKGEIRKRWNAVVEESDTCAVFSVVEGIGNSKYGIYAFCFLDMDSYPLYSFVSCYQGNRCIFEAKDFNLNTRSDSYVSVYIPQSAENDSLNTLERLLTDSQKEKMVGLAIYGYPKTSDFEYLRYNLLPQLEHLDLCHAEVDTMPERAFNVTLPENNATTKYIVLPKTLTHLSDNALCIYPNKVTYEITGKYPSLGKNIYSHEGRPSNNIFVVPSQGNKYLTLHTIDPTGGSSGPERGLLPMKQTKEEGDSLGGSVVVSMDGDTLYYVNPTACHKYAIPQNITRIHSNAMENKRLQASFNIPESVDFIGDRAFYGLQIVQTRNSSPVYYMSCSKNTPPLIGNEVFDESSLVTGSHVFYVNKESISYYKNTKGWNKLYYGDIDDVSGVEEVKTAEKQSPYYYDLQGRRLINPTKGLYIHNGKKVILR